MSFIRTSRVLTGGAGAGAGDVVGPAGVTDDRIACYDGTTGKLLKEGAVTCTDLAGAPFLSLGGGTMTGTLDMGSQDITAAGGIVAETVRSGRATFAVSTDTAALGDADVYACTDTSAARTLTISTSTIAQGSSTRPRLIVIKDDSLAAGTFNITIATEGAQTIDGAATATIGGNGGMIALLSDGTNLTSIGSNPYGNAVDRVPLNRGLNIRPIFTTADFGVAVSHAPSGGVMRVPLVLGLEYRIMAPTVVLPLFSYPSGAGTVVFSGGTLGANLLCPDPSGAVFWGRQFESFDLFNLTFIDISNAGAGRGVDILNMVGFGNARSAIRRVLTSFILFKSTGNLVDVFMGDANSDNVGLESGLTVRTNASAIPFLGASYGSIGSPLVGLPFLPDNRRPAVTFIGGVGQAGSSTVSVQLGKPANSAFYVDPTVVSGQVLMATMLYSGPAAGGEFFRPTLVQAVTSQVDASVTITSFSDSAVAPGVDTTVNFGTVVDFIRGQIVLLADEAAYDGLRTIVRVADDQESFDINVVFSTSGAGTLEMVEHIVADNKLARDETVVMTGTTDYNGTLQTLRVGDTSFHLPQEFVTSPQAGTATSTGQDKTSPFVNVQIAGAQSSSATIAFAEMNANATVTVIAAVDTYQALDASGLVENSVSERFTLTDTTAGVFTYNGIPDAAVRISATPSATKGGATQNYRFAPSVNGAIPVFATAAYAPMEVKSAKVDAIVTGFETVSTGNTVQIMVAGDGHSDNLTITDYIIEMEGF